MADFARPPKLVTITFETIADGTAIDPGAPLLKHRLKGGPAAGTELALTHTGTGTYTAEFDNVPGEHRLIAGSSDAADECDVEEATYTIAALEFPR